MEGYIPAIGRGIQDGTSHGLSYFARMVNIIVEDCTAKPSEVTPLVYV